MRALGPDQVTGSIPEDLRGALFRVGPGRCRVGDAKYAHWFDGDGAAFACSFEDASDETNAPVTVRAGIKFVRTSRFAAQERAGVDKGVAVRGAWTQADERNFPFANLFRFPTNPSNTAPLVHAGELLALCEGGAPVRVDKRTLDTLDDQSPGSAETKSVFAESAGRRLPMGFSAHAKRDSDGSLYTWGLAAPPSIGVQVARISATGEVTHVVDLPLCAGDLNGALSPERLEFALIHDCAMSEKHLVFVVPPWRLRPGFDGKLAKALAGATSFGHAFEWDDRKGAWLVVLRKSDLSVVVARETKQASAYHFCGARDEARRRDDGGASDASSDASDGHAETCVALVGELAGAATTWKRAATCTPVCGRRTGTTPSASTSSTSTRVLFCRTRRSRRPSLARPDAERARGRVAGQLPMEFPTAAPVSVRGRAPRFVYTLAFSGSGGGYFDAIQKLEAGAETHATRFLPPGVFPSEVEFVPKKNKKKADDEDAGYLLYLEYDCAAHASSVVVLDARDIAGAELARIHLPFHIPYTFHGTFEPE